MKLLIPLFFAFAQGSCYDYEYYDPQTGSSIPGNACARQAAAGGTTAGAVVGAPVVASQTFGAPVAASYIPIAAPITTPSYGVPVATAPVFTPATQVYGIAPAPQVQYTSAPFLPSAPVYGTSTVGAQYTVAAPVAVSAPYTVSTPYTIAAPVVTAPVVTVRAGGQGAVTAVRAGAQSAANPGLSAELEYYRNLGERQAEQRRRNTRIVREASEDLTRTSLFNRIIAGPNAATPFFPAIRLSLQKDVADAYKSEKRIANRNAEDAYQRYQNDPSRLNLLVSKYQDLNADLRDAAYQYNVVNSGTFGQRIANSGLLGGGLFSGVGITQIITQRQQSEDLQDIQRQMQRVQRQLALEAQALARANGAGAGAGVQQGSVQQRMMAMSVYGPQRG
jgi:hypothetical protein